MNKSKSGASGADAYISLSDAFENLGKALFQNDWDGECVRLGPGSYFSKYEVPPLYNPNTAVPGEGVLQIGSPLEKVSVRASEHQCKCFDDTLGTLKEKLWHQEFKGIGILNDGTRQNIEYKVWRDITGAYVISLFDSIITYTHGNRSKVWKVEIENIAFDEFVKTVNRKANPRKNLENLGRPPFDREALRSAIISTLKIISKNFLNRELCLGVERIYKGKRLTSIDIPSDSVIIKEKLDMKKPI